MNDTAGPLEGITALDLGVGLSGCLPGMLLAEMGATVNRVPQLIDDVFAEFYPAQRAWIAGKHEVTVDPAELGDLLDRVDVCIVGGDDHPDATTPLDPAALHASRPRLIVLSVGGVPPGFEGRALPAHELLAQVRSGLVWEQFPDRPTVYAVPLAGLGAVVQGLMLVLQALLVRESNGRGALVHASLLEGATSWLGAVWADPDQPKSRTDGGMPKGLRWPMVECADGVWVVFTQGSGGGGAVLDRILGLPEHDGAPSADRTPETFFGDMPRIAAAARTWSSADLITALQQVGIGSERVRGPGECWDDDQVVHNRTLRRLPDGTRYVRAPFAWSEKP